MAEGLKMSSRVSRSFEVQLEDRFGLNGLEAIHLERVSCRI